MTTAFQTHISDIYEATKLITGPLTSVEAFLLTDGSAAEVAIFKPALDTEINALSSKTAKSSAELLYLTVVVENTNVNGVPASSLSGLIEITDIVALPASHITGLEPVATGGNLAVDKVTGLNDAVSGLGYATTTSVNTALADYTLTSGLAPVATGGDLAVAKVTGLDAAVSGLGYATTTSVNTALADYTLTSGLAPVATGGALANSLVTGLADVATGGTLDAGLVILEEMATTYITDNRGFQIPAGTNVTMGLMVVDAKFGQLDTVVVKGIDGVIVGQQTPNNIFDVASTLQALESKTGYNADMEYPLSPSIANFNSITTHKLQFHNHASCSNESQIGATIDVTSSQKPLDVLFGYLSCEMVPYQLLGSHQISGPVYLQQDNTGCIEFTTNGAHLSTAAGLCHYYLFNDVPS